MSVSYYFENVPKLPLNKKIVSQWIKNTALSYGKKTGNISYIFCNDEKIMEINKQFLQHNYYTDIITFDYTEQNVISGDIFISLDTVKSNAEELNLIFEDELNRVIIHGILHLCGQNDKTESEQREMTMKEDLALNSLKKENL